MKNRIELPVSFDSFGQENLRTIITKDAVNVFPTHYAVKNWVFPYERKIGEEGQRQEIESTLEANLADAMGRVGEIYGVSPNELQHLFPAVLRMLKSNSVWTK